MQGGGGGDQLFCMDDEEEAADGIQCASDGEMADGKPIALPFPFLFSTCVGYFQEMARMHLIDAGVPTPRTTLDAVCTHG